MKYSLLSISFLVAYAKAKDTRFCWSKEYFNIECCPDDVAIANTDIYGDWGIHEGNVCGIRTGRCWSAANGIPCCPEGTKVENFDQDGEWGKNEKGEKCGIIHSKRRWNDRELIKDTKKEWDDFKIQWNDYKIDFQRISVFPGDNETELNFGWYSTTESKPVICWGEDETLESCKEYEGTVGEAYDVKGTLYYSNKVTVKDVKRDSIYYYKRKLNGKYENRKIQFNTYNSKNFSFIFVGDPQIGGAHDRYSPVNYYENRLSVDEGTRNDAFNWNRTISSAFEKAGQQPSLILSAGDQADEEDSNKRYNEEMQYSALLLPKQMQQIPAAAALGNHDNNFDTFRRHFNIPNPLTEPTQLNPKTGYLSAYNYFFKFNNVLVVVLETNHWHCADFKKIIVEGINKYPDTDWRIAMFHHDVYGNGEAHAHSDSKIFIGRPCMTKLLDKYNFDLVINGHDHVYTASHFVSYLEGANNEGEYVINKIKEGEVNKEPKGPLYITANCSTGSKLYNYVNTDYPYVHKNVQTFTSTFGILNFSEDANDVVRLNITSYEVENHNITDGPYILEKQRKKCLFEPEYRCCKQENPTIVYSDDEGDWGVENDEWCGINKKQIKELEDVDISKYITDRDIYIDYDNEDMCWAKSLGYKCCRQKIADVEYTDKYGDWGKEDGSWCGIYKCWAEGFGYKCCSSKNPTVYSTDQYGEWGYENDDWCGILREDECWAKRLGYMCCSEGNEDIIFTDENGKWGLENDVWCGMIEREKIDNNKCWAEKLNYKCCSDENTPSIYTDNDGEWGNENGEWCGIIKKGNNNPSTSTTTTTTSKTKTTTTTTTTRTTTTTKTTTTTTTKTKTTTTTTTTTKTPEPSNCVANWGQCGGNGYTGSTCCQDSNATCVKYSNEYSQCVPKNNY